MTHGYGPSAQPKAFSDKVLSNQEAEDCLIPMGITSENVAKEFGIPRSTQDEFAAKSFQKAAAAQKAGKFTSEIIPVTVTREFVDMPKFAASFSTALQKELGPVGLRGAHQALRCLFRD